MPKTTSAKRKPEPTPSLVDQAMTLLESTLEAPAELQREVLLAWRDGIDDYLDRIAEARRPVSIPVGFVKLQYLAKGHGDCFCKALAELLKQ